MFGKPVRSVSVFSFLFSLLTWTGLVRSWLLLLLCDGCLLVARLDEPRLDGEVDGGPDTP